MKTIIKRLQKQKSTTLLKIISLGIGIACTLALFYVAFNELNYDKFYQDKDQIFQVFTDIKTNNSEYTGYNIFQPVAKTMMNDLSMVKYGTTVRNVWNISYVFNKRIIEAKTMHADTVFFNIFDRPFILGNSKECLADVNTAVVTKSFANKMFGRTDVIGETLNMRGSRLISIEGVIEDWPDNSSFNSEVIVSFETLRAEKRLYMGWYGGDSFNGYIKVPAGVSAEQVESHFPDLLAKYMDVKEMNEKGFYLKFRAIPITEAPFLKNSRLKSSIFILLLLGALLLGLVCFNALLLTMSQQQKMLKELSIRRIQGSSKPQIFKLLLQDAIFQFLLSIFIAFIVLQIIAPLVMANFRIDLWSAINTAPFLALFLAITGILFVAIFIIPGQWSLRKISQQKHKLIRKKDSILTDIPLAFQVGISFTLLVFFWFIFKQLDYIQNFDKGYESKNVAYIQLNNKQLFSKDKILKRELSSIPGVESVGLSDDIPLYGLSGNNFGPESDGSKHRNFRNLRADMEFFSTLGIDVQGTGFTETANQGNKVIISESVAKDLGLEDPINQTIYRNFGQPFIIAGIIPDLIYGTLHSGKQGVVFNYYDEPDVYSTLTFSLDPNNTEKTLKAIKNKVAEIVPGTIPQVKFYDAELMASYQLDYAIRKAIIFFAIIAVLLTISGIVGYSINSIQKRIKEIGVRKVNGASEWSLLQLLNRSFIIKSIISLLLFAPVSWWLTNTWIQNYAYHIDISPVVFGVLSLVIVMVVFTTITLAVLENVRKNPVEALRYE